MNGSFQCKIVWTHRCEKLTGTEECYAPLTHPDDFFGDSVSTSNVPGRGIESLVRQLASIAEIYY